MNVYGHIVIICIGIPIIFGLVKSIRELRLQSLLLLNIDKMKTDSDALNQIFSLQKLIKESCIKHKDDVTLIGIVNLHVLECQNMECPCKNESALYDAASEKFSSRKGKFKQLYKLVGYHKDLIFLNHLIKKFYEEALNKFGNSTLLRVAFAFYLFDTMKNIHAALIELNLSSKKKPSLQQQFSIFRFKDQIEDYIESEETQNKDMYAHLTNVIEFERLLQECQKAIERVCNQQIEFWTQIANQMPDLNILNDLGKKIYDESKTAEEFWNDLCKINPVYPKALNLYGNYMMEIKNHYQLGYELIEKLFYYSFFVGLKQMLIKNRWKD